MFESGSSIPNIVEPAVKKRDDYACLADILSKVRIHPRPDKFHTYYNRVGNAGVAVAFLSLACGPMHHIMRDLRKNVQKHGRQGLSLNISRKAS